MPKASNIVHLNVLNKVGDLINYIFIYEIIILDLSVELTFREDLSYRDSLKIYITGNQE